MPKSRSINFFCVDDESSLALVIKDAANLQPVACSLPRLASCQPVDVSLAGLAPIGSTSSLRDMVRLPRKISMAQCVRQDNSTVTIWCVSPGERAPYGGGPNVCGHNRELPIDEAIQLFGLETSLSDFRVRCTVCGGRAYDAPGRGDAAARPPVGQSE